MAGYDLKVDTEMVKVHAKGMAVKTVTIDLEAYAALSRHKRAGQSFSQVIREHFGRQRTDRDLLTLRERLTLSEETLDAIDAMIEELLGDPARPVDL